MVFFEATLQLSIQGVAVESLLNVFNNDKITSVVTPHHRSQNVYFLSGFRDRTFKIITQEHRDSRDPYNNKCFISNRQHESKGNQAKQPNGTSYYYIHTYTKIVLYNYNNVCYVQQEVTLL